VTGDVATSTANAERQAAFKARMREHGKRQLTVWVTSHQAHAIVTYLAGGGDPLPAPALATRDGDERHPSTSLPVTPPAAQTSDDALALLRRALAHGQRPRFKKTVLPNHGQGWEVFVGPHPVAQVWKASSGYGWEGRQTLRVSWLDALSPDRARTREQTAWAVLTSLGLGDGTPPSTTAEQASLALGEVAQ